MIEVQNLSKEFGGRPAIKRVNFQVGKGEILGFLGPNGAGKTTTMRILTCYLSPDEGSAKVAGFDVWSQPMEVKRRIGYLPETPPLYAEMTVGAYLDFVAKIRAIPGAKRRGAAGAALERCGLAGVRHRLIGNLSKGFKQRVGLAQAIIHDPPVLVLDEPTVGLDPEQIIEIRELIKSLGGNHTIILSTHILPEVTVTCTRVAIISYGEIVQEGTIAELAEGAGAEKVRVRIARDSEAVATELGRVEGVVAATPGAEAGSYMIDVRPGSPAREKLAVAAVTQGWGLLEMVTVTRTLEEIYLEATRRLSPVPADGAPLQGDDGGNGAGPAGAERAEMTAAGGGAA